MLIILGMFDHTQGGQLVLHELKVVIELAPGDVIFFPSALITHQNLPILPHEFHYSITGYTAGNLFQLRDQRFHSKAQVRRLIKQEVEAIRKGKGNQHYLEELKLIVDSPKDGMKRWGGGWKLFSTIEQLRRSQ
ncbi:hypothetical protein BOTBODRAFT_180494 [Botryobasidium botryosum FD-172 SS1]|uniref:Uncharacterized protein n=1 Tax=Botryobasidium botryosum (strain FD-172 SS1) TaxID=930990 RepID=A0A067LWQ0_BOTB1|nr:hypothetical protein BOTBODRAFT_180494 [Botryobasidium botryosum FD-172 SS1]